MADVTQRKIAAIGDTCEYIVGNADSMAYFAQILAGAVIAATGFATNSETTVIGSMLISPIGGLILKLGRSAANAKVDSAQYSPVKKLTMTFVIPVLVGMIMASLTNHEPTDEQGVVKGRGYDLSDNMKSLWAGAVVALAAAFLFSWAEDVPSVGIGIATALLPPMTAVGWYIGKILKQKNRTTAPDEKEPRPYEWKDVGSAMLIFMVNFLILVSVTFAIESFRRGDACDRINILNRKRLQEKMTRELSAELPMM